MATKVVLVSHGKLSEGVADAVEMVFGKSEALSYLGLAPDGNVVELIGGLRERVASAPGDQFVVLADLFGGSVCTQCLEQLSGFDNVTLVSGLSMGLALSVLSNIDEPAPALAEQAVLEAREGTKVVELLSADALVDSGEDDFF